MLGQSRHRIITQYEFGDIYATSTFHTQMPLQKPHGLHTPIITILSTIHVIYRGKPKLETNKTVVATERVSDTLTIHRTGHLDDTERRGPRVIPVQLGEIHARENYNAHNVLE